LKAELERQLLLVEAAPFTFETRDHHGKSHWLVQLFDKRGERHCDVWFGINPDAGWGFDGLVRRAASFVANLPTLFGCNLSAPSFDRVRSDLQATDLPLHCEQLSELH
jgi:hypothetical protein